MEDYNRLIIEQINRQLKSGFDSSLRTDTHSVVKTTIPHVLSVLPTNSINDGIQPVFGPDTFAACIQYVNTYLVYEPEVKKKDSAKPPSTTSDEESDEENQT